MVVNNFYQKLGKVKEIKKGLDKGFGFAKLKIVNPTAFLRFGGRRQFYFL